MGLLKRSSDGKNDRDYRQISLLAAVPAILIDGPLVGYFLGQWADEYWGTEPYLMTLGVVLGFVAAGREIVTLVKRAQAIEREKEKDDNGT
jgi:F0F1-type ATP synthase assembly protein I